MTDNNFRGSQGTQRLEATATPVCLVRGIASPEELAALVTIFAAASSNGAPDPTDRLPMANARFKQPPWGSPRRMMRTTPPHGPGGWRASTRPR
ncbi:MAG TPA: acyl-CoA carboxylase subunit epsilon [Dermatophilaceae bacterium]|nr:acyl-CoA carboxylase subunit epsilon [Dermatophilaceae bacterium]